MSHTDDQQILDSAYNLYKQVTASPDMIMLAGYVYPNSEDTMIYGIDSNQNVSSMMQETVYMYERSDERYSIHVNLVDAISGMDFELDDSTLVELFIRRGINNKFGEVFQRIAVDSYDYEPISLPPGNFTAEIRIPGYESNYFTISTLHHNLTVNSNIVPKIAEGEVKIVLTWSSHPEDLDSHLFSPNGDHILYYSRETRNGWLDVD